MTSNLGTPQLHEAILAQQAALEAGDLDEDEPPLDAEAVVRRLTTRSRLHVKRGLCKVPSRTCRPPHAG